MFNLLFAVGWVVAAFVVSATMLTAASPAKTTQLRMRQITGMTTSTWIQSQVYALAQVPLFYAMRRFCLGLLNGEVNEFCVGFCAGLNGEEYPKAEKPTGAAVVAPLSVEMERFGNNEPNSSSPSTDFQPKDDHGSLENESSQDQQNDLQAAEHATVNPNQIAMYQATQ